MDKVRVRVIIAYDGASYAGWQVQKTGVGVQQKMEEALGRLFPSGPRIHGSSRTDTGVHALGMVAHVDIPRPEFKIPIRKLALALNAFLPEDIRVLAASSCRGDFHARFDAAGKQYRYFVWNHPVMNPLWRGRAWHVPQRLDLDAMRSASEIFLGRHDFKSFAATRNYEMESTIRALWRCEIKRSGPLLTFILEGDGFLYKMCRGIVGTLVQLGQRKYSRTDLKQMLAARDRRTGGMTAPAHGLVLWRVFYHRARSKKGQRPRKAAPQLTPIAD